MNMCTGQPIRIREVKFLTMWCNIKVISCSSIYKTQKGIWKSFQSVRHKNVGTLTHFGIVITQYGIRELSQHGLRYQAITWTNADLLSNRHVKFESKFNCLHSRNCFSKYHQQNVIHLFRPHHVKQHAYKHLVNYKYFLLWYKFQYRMLIVEIMQNNMVMFLCQIL